MFYVLILERGVDLIEQKNSMIEVLKHDLAESDSRFLQEQAAQSEDIRIVQERIENQVKFIRKQYKNHIRFIKVSKIGVFWIKLKSNRLTQSVIDQQRQFRVDAANEEWEHLYNEIMSNESDSIDNRLAMIEKKENNIMKQYEMNEEIIRNLKSDMNAELHVRVCQLLIYWLSI